jgi:hypothetical protein
MKKPVFYLCLLGFSLIFMGCPYESMVPIDQPNVKVEKANLGSWKNVATESSYEYVVTQDGDYVYEIEEITFGSEGSENTSKFYKGHISDVNGQKFMNLKGQEKDDSYMLFKVDMNGSEVVFSDVTPHIQETFSRSSDLKTFIAEHMHLSFFFGEENTYSKK